MADQIHDTTEFQYVIPELWSPKLYDVLLANLVVAGTVNRDYEGEIRNMGDTVHIISVPEAAAADVDQIAGVDAPLASPTSQDLVIDKWKASDHIIGDMARWQANLDYRNSYRDAQGYALAKAIEQSVIDAILPSAATPDHQITYSAGTTLALADMLAIKELLDGADVPPDNRFIACSPAQYNDLLALTQVTSNDYIPAGSPASSGSINIPAFGFKVLMSTLLPANVCYAYHASFLSLAIQKSPRVKEADMFPEKGKRAIRIGTDVLYGLKQLDDERVVKISA